MRIPIEKLEEMSLSEKEDTSSPPLYFQLNSFPSKNEVIASLQAPAAPANPVHHVPCDIVLVIDVSASMFSAAPVPGEDTSEENGLSILDLVKHASLTIIETMDERDRLSIVTFSSDAEVLQPLVPMTEENKIQSRANIRGMRDADATNLWHGLLAGLRQFDSVNTSGKVPAVLVLTDGMPNHMCPPAGYVPKLRAKLPLPATIHTFGFGYTLRSGLLKSIAEIGNGNYCFIPDAGIIGTAFVHAVANLQSTFATDASLELKYPQPTVIRDAMGQSATSPLPEPIEGTDLQEKLTIPLGNIQYSQSRDAIFRFHSPHLAKLCNMELGPVPIVEATITYRQVLGNKEGSVSRVMVSQNLLEKSTMPEALAAYHESRAQICSFLSNLFPLGKQGEHSLPNFDNLPEAQRDLATLIEMLPARNFTDTLNQSLMEDLVGEEPHGQISIALSQAKFFDTWGRHYLPSLLNAHTRQVCNSFKDPGPLQYGSESSLFIACRDRLDEAFDNLPPPEPSRSRFYKVKAPFAQPTSMSSYRAIAGGCFAGSTPVQLASGRGIEIRRLRRGMKVQTPLGSRKVAAVVRIPLNKATLCRVGSVLVTPWHPISHDGKAWTFPAYTADRAVSFTGSVYTIMLQRDRNPDAHAMRLDGIWGVTLGHGLTSGGDSRAHSFFGDYSVVGKSLLRLGVGLRGEFVAGGVERDSVSGLVTSFKADKSQGRTLGWSAGTRAKAMSVSSL